MDFYRLHENGMKIVSVFPHSKTESYILVAKGKEIICIKLVTAAMNLMPFGSRIFRSSNFVWHVARQELLVQEPSA